MPGFQGVLCDPGAIRTRDPQLRRLLLYPAELRDQNEGAKVRIYEQSHQGWLILPFSGLQFGLQHVTRIGY